jgi:3-hydroxy-3-methylglutaryl CoA synthase
MKPVGIRSFGCYVPRARLSRAAIAEAWGRPAEPGERSVAQFDEDAVTMSVEAGLDALAGIEGKTIGAVYFASGSGPFAEKGAADVVAAALEMRFEIPTADFGGGPRAFGAALRAACDAVRAGSCRNVLVVAADVRPTEPGSAAEPWVGDAGAAVVVSADDLICEVEQQVAMSDDFAPVWRLSGDRFLRSDDDKVASEAYVTGSMRVAKRVLELAARDGADLARVVAYALDGASFRALLKTSGMGERFFVENGLADVGNPGAASLPLQLGQAIEGLRPGNRILAVGWAGGGDGFLLRILEGIDAPRAGRGLSAWLRDRSQMRYQDYLRHRDLVASRAGLWHLEPFVSLTSERREGRQLLRLQGTRCLSCTAIGYPIRPVCRKCGQAGPFEYVRLGRRGTIVTWNRDHVFPGPGAPLANVVVDLEGGGRILTQLTDGEPSIGQDVELTLRKFHEGRGVPHYWWKATRAEGARNPSPERLAATAGAGQP